MFADILSYFSLILAISRHPSLETTSVPDLRLPPPVNPSAVPATPPPLTAGTIPRPPRTRGLFVFHGSTVTPAPCTARWQSPLPRLRVASCRPSASHLQRRETPTGPHTGKTHFPPTLWFGLLNHSDVASTRTESPTCSARANAPYPGICNSVSAFLVSAPQSGDTSASFSRTWAASVSASRLGKRLKVGLGRQSSRVQVASVWYVGRLAPGMHINIVGAVAKAGGSVVKVQLRGVKSASGVRQLHCVPCRPGRVCWPNRIWERGRLPEEFKDCLVAR